MRIPRSLLAALVVSALVAGCGGDDEDEPTTTSTAQAQTTVTETVTAPPATTDTGATDTGETEAPPADEEQAPGEGSGCSDDSGNQIQILSGDVDCDAAREVAGNYDQQGERVQEVGEFVCEGGNAQTRPIIFTCTGPGGEFTVSEPGG